MKIDQELTNLIGIDIENKLNRELELTTKITKTYQIEQINCKCQYFGYNSEYDCINDYGWGCAWRAIQMVLSGFLAQIPTFQYLFTNFGNHQILQKLFEIKNIYQQEFQAPFDLKNGWAEPYVLYCISAFYNKNAKLYKVNTQQIQMYGPQKIFEENIIDFKTFVQILLNHFQNFKTAIMIDCGLYAKTIISIRLNYNNIILKIADPHINNNIINKEIGIYEIELDQNGNLLNILNSGDYQQYYDNGASVKKNDFNQISWMVCILEC